MSENNQSTSELDIFRSVFDLNYTEESDCGDEYYLDVFSTDQRTKLVIAFTPEGKFKKITPVELE
jgi:hypothetical protein